MPDLLRFPQINPPPHPHLWITDDLLFNHLRCHRRAFLDVYGQDVQRDPPSDYLQKLRQDSIAHQLTVLGDAPTHQPRYPSRDWQAGATATLELMRQGVERIVRGVLLVQQADGICLVSCPDVLINHPGQSIFGDWLYVPTEIKLGKRPKLDYQLIGTYHAYLLAAVQGAWSETSWLMLRQRGPYAIDLEQLLPKMQAALDGCIQMIKTQQEPEVFIAHNRCDLCHWFSHCYGKAQQEEHLSLLPGVTPSRYIYLKQAGVTRLENLAKLSPRHLESLPGFGSQVAHKLILQAQSTLHQRALPHSPFQDNPDFPLLTEDELPTHAVELYFDIEAAPEQNLVYLHGVLVVDRHQQTDTFYPLLADAPDQEEAIWQKLWDLIWQYPDAPIFHFCPYEVQTVRRLAERYNDSLHDLDRVLDRFVDLHERVTRVATLPVESYALKPIARWLGFNWRDADANGAQSIYWYAQWLQTGDRQFLDAIVRYNEDDCRATYRVKEWLADFVRGEV